MKPADILADEGLPEIYAYLLGMVLTANDNERWA